jgi:hypothetical protein
MTPTRLLSGCRFFEAHARKAIGGIDSSHTGADDERINVGPFRQIFLAAHELRVIGKSGNIEALAIRLTSDADKRNAEREINNLTLASSIFCSLRPL